MKMKHVKTMLKSVLALAMAISLVGCATPQDASKQTSEITLQDQSTEERTVTIDEPAKSVVSCYYVTTYAMLSLGISDRLVGIEKKADTREIYKMANEELLDLPQVGSLKQINVEQIAKLNPDLVILPMKLKDNLTALEDLGITTIIVNPESHDELVEMLTLIGKACGVEDKAKAFTDYYTEQLKTIESYGKVDMNVYMTSNSSYLETAPESMYQSSLITSAGGNNAAKDIEGDYWTKVSYESLLKMNPDMIVIPAGASFTKEDILKDKQLSSLKAVQNKAIYQMPQGLEEWDAPVPSGILGSMWLASILHEDQYSFETFQKDAKDFYKTFYGFDVDTSLLTK